MINPIASTRAHVADIAALRETRAKKTEPAKDATVENGEAHKTAHPHGKIPPGLARAAERISSKIFARADADASGTVTLQELSAIHSAHARTLASSELFEKTTAETPTDVATPTPVEIAANPTPPAIDVTTETTSETPIESGITEAQLKEALTKSFYAKVGVIYTTSVVPTTEPAAPAPASATTPSVVESISDESESNQSFTAVA